jgi:hypothetical protein
MKLPSSNAILTIGTGRQMYLDATLEQLELVLLVIVIGLIGSVYLIMAAKRRYLEWSVTSCARCGEMRRSWMTR